MKKLINLVCQWSVEKGIKDNSTVETQLLYTQSELSELYLAMSKKDLPEIQDAIGDVTVTLINALYIVTNSVQESENMILDYLSKQKLNKTYSVFEVYSILQMELKILFALKKNQKYIGKVFKDSVTTIMMTLDSVARQYDLELEDCLLSAYEVISKRTGKNVNGVFVKDK